jgi:hypothetical protein
MAFLDNSGDIILDAVLTDTGRYRLAKGDGSFKIVKFALADDEINYASYDKDHVSGSAFFDLTVLQTPVLEAFTNNTSTMNSKLISIPRTNLLFLPTMKINEVVGSKLHTSGSFFVAVDEDTETSFDMSNAGWLAGATLTTTGGSIKIDQGLDTTEIPPSFAIDADLVETQYIIEIDDRLGKIAEPKGSNFASMSFRDDDNIASYFLSLGTDTNFVSKNVNKLASTGTESIAGPRGTTLDFRILSSLELNTSTYLFTQIGSTATMVDKDSANQSVRFIDSIVRVTGATTGTRVDIPVRFIKNI